MRARPGIGGALAGVARRTGPPRRFATSGTRQESVLAYRRPGPHFSMAGATHHWHRGHPPQPYLWVLR